MTIRTNTQQSKKRKISPTSNEKSSVSPRKVQKKNSDKGDDVVKFSSYPSTIFNLDVQELLKYTRTEHELFFNHRIMRDELIMIILKEYEASLIKKNNGDDGEEESDQGFGSNVLTYGKMNIKDNFQYKRNQCKIVAEAETREMYLCVHSSEFTSPLAANSTINKHHESVFIFDNWLVYRCDAMKAKYKECKIFQTQSTMIGNKEDTKSFHWLGIYDGYCSIRQLESKVDEVREESKGEGSEECVLLRSVKEELDKGLCSPLLTILPYNEAQLKGVAPVHHFDVQAFWNNRFELQSTNLFPGCVGAPVVEVPCVVNIPSQTTDDESKDFGDKLPIHPSKDMIWDQPTSDLKQFPPKQKGLDGSKMFEEILRFNNQLSDVQKTADQERSAQEIAPQLPIGSSDIDELLSYMEQVTAENNKQ